MYLLKDSRDNTSPTYKSFLRIPIKKLLIKEFLNNTFSKTLDL